MRYHNLTLSERRRLGDTVVPIRCTADTAARFDEHRIAIDCSRGTLLAALIEIADAAALAAAAERIGRHRPRGRRKTV